MTAPKAIYERGILNGTTEEPKQGIYETSATQNYVLGTRLNLPDGRSFRYAKAGATQLEPALMAQSEATASEAKEIAQTGYTTSIGDTTITALLTTSNGLVDDELRDGTLLVNKGTGLGYAYPIDGNTWVTGDTVMSIDLKEAIVVATAATSEFTFTKNQFADLIVAPTTLTGLCVGVPIVQIPAGYYGWVQTKGTCPIIVDTAETVVVGEVVGYPAAPAVAGACGVTAVTDMTWGTVVEVGAAAEPALVNLNLE